MIPLDRTIFATGQLNVGMASAAKAPRGVHHSALKLHLCCIWKPRTVCGHFRAKERASLLSLFTGDSPYFPVPVPGKLLVLFSPLFSFLADNWVSGYCCPCRCFAGSCFPYRRQAADVNLHQCTVLCNEPAQSTNTDAPAGGCSLPFHRLQRAILSWFPATEGGDLS